MADRSVLSPAEADADADDVAEADAGDAADARAEADAVRAGCLNSSR
jgi:hypothetical protein